MFTLLFYSAALYTVSKKFTLLVRCDFVICLGRGADLHMAQLIPLPLTVACSRKSRLVLVLPFWYRLTRVVPDKIQRAVKWLYQHWFICIKVIVSQTHQLFWGSANCLFYRRFNCNVRFVFSHLLSFVEIVICWVIVDVISSFWHSTSLCKQDYFKTYGVFYMNLGVGLPWYC